MEKITGPRAGRHFPGRLANIEYPGLLVSFEGLDGSGKSTIIEKVEALLRMRGLPVSSLAEFSNSVIGNHLAERLTTDKFLREVGQSPTAATLALTVLTDWMYMNEYQIVPLLEANS